MRGAKPEFDVWIEVSDLERIRDAVRRWGKPTDVVEAYSGSMLHDQLGAWRQFVETDWSHWDISEYGHDNGCRVWIQLAIESSSPETSERIRRAAHPSDEAFRAKMVPAVPWCRRTTPVLKSHPYFWETHTIHPELHAEGAA